VTGASRGIGRAIALQLGREGAQVFATARDEAKLAELVAEIKGAGGQASSARFDLSQPTAGAQLAANAVEVFGGIDIVVNNAGATKRGEFLELTEADWADGFALKFFGAVRLIRAAWPSLRERRGSVLNIAGVGGRTPGIQFTIGGSVNAAMLSLTKALADLGIRDHVQVNAVNPGPIRTERLDRRLAALAKEKGIPLDQASGRMVADDKITRLGEPEDVAELVAFIVSPQGRFLHGSLIDIDGGSTKTL
jgi:3-oxoacyl-[acyl-carrier protein] reductase